jgi:hypothetical protein
MFDRLETRLKCDLEDTCREMAGAFMVFIVAMLALHGHGLAEDLEITLTQARQMQVKIAGATLEPGQRVVVPREQLSIEVMTWGPIRKRCADPEKYGNVGRNTVITERGRDGCAWEVHSGTFHGYARWRQTSDTYRYSPPEYVEAAGPKARVNPPDRVGTWKVTVFGDTKWNYGRKAPGGLVKKDEKEEGFAALSIIVRFAGSPFPAEGTPIGELQAQQLAETVTDLYGLIKDRDLLDLIRAAWGQQPPIEPIDYMGQTPVYPRQAEVLKWWTGEVAERLKYNPASPFSDPMLFFFSRGYFNLTRTGNDPSVVEQHGLGRCGDVYQYTIDHFDNTFPKDRGKLLGLVTHFDLVGVYPGNHVTNVIPPIGSDGKLKTIDPMEWHGDWKKTGSLSGIDKQRHIKKVLKKYDGAIVIDSWTRKSMPLKEWVSKYRNRNDARFVGARGSEQEG